MCLTSEVCLSLAQVILFNFFEESAKPDLWRHFIDMDHQGLWEEKLAPLIHEVSGDNAF